jgi:hypothetical protein
MGDKVILMAGVARPKPWVAQALDFAPVMLLARLLL